MPGGSFKRYRGKTAMAEMNVVPLVDVMLVLLVIFIVTAPLLTHSVKIDLPKASSSVNITKPEHIEFGIRESGDLFWNGEAVTMDLLASRFAPEAAREPQPELHIRADRHVHYEKVAQVMALAAKSGLVRIGFVSDPAH
ncbi:biopolymer transporter ExbD [Accumulibacter sp.]|jgi:biopolymer transport protein ExbD|uniref:Biopolymer transport protein ExbD/TolR n=1 Tax=Accumulibacter regalis TaxID=522306 RepID=C7RMD3_ACCRE|nr:biopolymer transporter ExbD [Accumulibacter sp.]MBN8498251.1 biopolymer transporter ExbD [Accumulibacter sp.]MBO3715041.1 biopolymer transporter ExbD [Accumulibacter sp.]